MSHPIKTEEVFVVVPAYNEGVILQQVLAEVLALGYRIVLVDDGSNPKLQLPFLPRLSVLRHRINLGQGAAIQTGLEYALAKGAKLIVTFDADGQHRAGDIERLIQAIHHSNASVALGSRFLPGADSIPAGRRRLLQLARYINFVFTGLLLTDAHNGLRAFTADAAHKLALQENRMAHATELVHHIKKEGLHYIEVPVTIRYTDYARRKGQGPMDSFRILLDLLLSKLFK